MSDRCDYFHRQRVTEAELDLGFEQLEQADRDLASDLGIYGIISGAEPAQHEPVADLSIDLTAPGRAYDRLGQRLFFGVGQTVGCSVDLDGVPTEVTTAGNERWLGVFLRFTRLLSDPRTDGNSQQVFFRRDESFAVVVRQAPEGLAGSAPRPSLHPDELLVCEIRLRPGQTQILTTDIDLSRRQLFIFAAASSVGVQSSLWSVLRPATQTAQAALDEVDAELREHFGGSARRHAAAAVDFDAAGFLRGQTVQSALEGLVSSLASTSGSASGASLIGAPERVALPNSLPASTIAAQLQSLLGFINTHLGATSGAHAARAVSFSGLAEFVSQNVQDALFELATAFGGDHFGPTSINTGQHDTVHQPQMTGTRALLWHSVGLSGGSQLRVYVDATTLWFVLNARWVGSGWQRDVVTRPAAALRVSGTEFAIERYTESATVFTTWTSTVSLGEPGGPWNVAGPAEEQGHIAVSITNHGSTRTTVRSYVALNYRYRFAGSPTLDFQVSESTGSSWSTRPQNGDRFGCTVEFGVVLGPNETGFWYGTYTVQQS